MEATLDVVKLLQLSERNRRVEFRSVGFTLNPEIQGRDVSMAKEKKYWDEEMETMPLDKLHELREQRLQEAVTNVYEKSIFYRRKWDEAGVKPTDISKLEDIQKLPIIEDAEYRSSPILERITVPLSEVKAYCSSGGTTGIPDILPRTQEDWEECFARVCRVFWTLGIRPGDTIRMLTGFECHQRAYELLGASVMLLHAGRGVLDNQIRLDQMANVNILNHIASLVWQYFERARELGVKHTIRKVLAVGEGLASSYEHKLEQRYGFTFFPNSYGSTEARFNAVECEERQGMHILADRCIVEVIDPETKKVLGPGEEGELIITTLLPNECVPMIRWRSADIATLLPYEPCPCGRTAPKISSKIRGRMAFMTRVKGIRVFPMDVEEALGNIPEAGDEFQIIREKPGEQEILKLRVEHSPEVKKLDALRGKIEDAVGQALGIDAEVELVPPGSIKRVLFKAQRLINTF
jgi:phenylacetate-CoA ligase